MSKKDRNTDFDNFCNNVGLSASTAINFLLKIQFLTVNLGYRYLVGIGTFHCLGRFGAELGATVLYVYIVAGCTAYLTPYKVNLVALQSLSGQSQIRLLLSS